ncbi:MAG: AAA family ATPase, partial [Planctomycetaceae bacterium]|nr:AAA family ATPase [Planctomycetaceae bacterium]
MNLTICAQRYVRSGLSVLAADPPEKRPTLPSWKPFQHRLPTDSEITQWFGAADGLCIVTGAVSGNLEVLDFDAAGELFSPWYAAVASQAPDLVDRLVIERSPSDGLHVAYRCEHPVCGSLKLAQRRMDVPTGDQVEIAGKMHVPRRDGDKWVVLLTLIETRGEGGLVLCDPTPGYELQQESYVNLPVVTAAERDLLLQTAWELTEYRPVPEPTPIPRSEPMGRPGDDFNARGNVSALLQSHGWHIVRGGENEYWRRPGKTEGWSATLKDRVLYVFSSNAAPFEPGRAYSPFGVYALLEHSGDFGAAARGLRQLGYGEPVTSETDVDLTGLLKRPGGTGPQSDRDIPDVRLLARRVCDVRREQLEWLWQGRIPLGKLTLLAGDPGLGKSMVSIDITARVSRGGCWPDNTLLSQRAGTVIMFNAEDDLEDTISPRLDAAEADDRRVIVVEGVEARSEKARIQRSFSLEADLPRLEGLLDE